MSDTEKLKSLDEHNSEKRALHDIRFSNNPTKNGIACPDCGKELYDSSPMTTLLSWPSQKNVHCDCGYGGFRVE